MRDIYILEYCWTVEKNKIIKFADGWMDLETMTLSEIAHIPKGKYFMFSLISQCYLCVLQSK